MLRGSLRSQIAELSHSLPQLSHRVMPCPRSGSSLKAPCIWWLVQEGESMPSPLASGRTTPKIHLNSKAPHGSLWGFGATSLLFSFSLYQILLPSLTHQDGSWEHPTPTKTSSIQISDSASVAQRTQPISVATESGSRKQTKMGF